MSDTPRTDAARKHAFTNSGMRSESVVPVSLAYELERDLAQRTAERDALAADLAQRTAERDEARREVCVSEANLRYHDQPDEMTSAFRARKIADERGWDCFDAKEMQR